MRETVLYGIPRGCTERYEEVLLLTNATDATIARVAVIDLSSPPDFGGTVR
jgi:hypothetical protein